MQNERGMPVRKRATSLAHGLVEALSQRILLGQFSPGEKLPSETAIVREHGVSRTVVREAISKLQASGLVETRHGIGTFVLERESQLGLQLNIDTAASVKAVLELRMGLEVQAVALAALRRSDEQLTRMRQALDDYRASLASNDSCAEEDRRFHQLIAEATGNRYFTEIMQHLGEAMIPRAQVNADERGAIDFSHLGYLAHLEHEAIFNAISRKDPDAARAAMVLHLSGSRDRFSGNGSGLARLDG
ncbi:FadR/GntR family transcriptional regulator [Pseudomonas sp. R5(2019)]|uniref:FadR/GntR family transcriptional regulator n=1 Tax=Pseudomonas sp. R5(2019) TaxID=2697566 RepID=UPI0014121C0F|nr:FadR/GntR family transcriptional regulator [Pseudomonas sp. R5(2019)]NBA95470.1 FCD domain-containing protein [Pseudomonas sp. R5(2019)]